MSPLRSKKKRGASRRAVEPRHNVVTSSNDHLSRALADIVPDKWKGTNRCLDVIQWNIEWFGAKKSIPRDKKRMDLVIDILDTLNGDLFVFQEVKGPSADGRYDGVLDYVAAELTHRGAGDYVVYYTKAGGEQRVAMMYDRDFVVAKDDVGELFPRGTYKKKRGKDPFAGRTPLYGYFSARVPQEDPDNPDPAYALGNDKFDFQVLGVHLKAMESGHQQRLASAKILADWMTVDAVEVDSDVMIVGDWNAPPNNPCWEPFHKIDAGRGRKVAFRDINDDSDFSYMWLRNKTTKHVSRIDLTAMSLSSLGQVKGKAAKAVRWKPIEKAIKEAGDTTAKEVRDVMRALKEEISDHLPIVSRFYYSEQEGRPLAPTGTGSRRRDR